MFKRYYLIFLIIALIFLLIPSSFAQDNNITGNEAIISEFTDNSVLESNDLLNEIHVEATGSDDNDGSEAKPVATISKALNISSNHSKIVIHEGVYKENNLNITKSLEIISHGNVIIDAENSSRIFTINTKTTGDEVILSGITFINGRAYNGGAIYVRNAMTTIENSKFVNNTALTEGGAIYWNAPNGKLTNCIFEENYALDGSAVSWGGSQSDDPLRVESDYGEINNCTFEDNHFIIEENVSCIGVSVYSNHVNVINSKFINHYTNLNTSFEVLYINGDNALVSGCLFENNTLTMTGALGLDGNYATASNNLFINNTMTFDDSFGGAIGIQSENSNIYNNTFISNGGKSGVGGAIFINTIETFSFNFINIVENRFKDNFAYYGGSIYATGKSNMLTLKIQNNTFDGDNAIYGSAIFLTDIYNPITVENNNFTNIIAQEGVGIYSTHSILQLNKNLVKNYTSQNYGFIYTDGEIRSQVYLRFSDGVSATGHPATLTAELFDDMNNSISSKAISFTSNGEKVTGKTGLNNITTTFNTIGSYNISGSFNSPKLNIENGTFTIIKGANLNIQDMINYGKNVDIKVTLTDDNGVLSGKEIILNLDDVNYLLFTDSNGEAKINLDLNYNTYNITATLNEDDYYRETASSSLTVLPSINASDMIRAYNSGYDFIAKVFDKDGSPLKNANIILKVNTEEYSLKTDGEGIVKLTKLPVGSYVVRVINPISGDSLSKNIKIVKRITKNENIKMYFGAGKYYKVRVYNDDGSVAGKNQAVVFKINGKTYTRKTDKNGYASFKITLPSKTYTITATYKGVKVSNKIIVKPVLTAKNISKKKSKTTKFSAKLVNTKGKVVKGKKITFKFKGKTYKVKTNKKGIATLTLKNLKVGKYTIKTIYGKSAIKNTIKIKK